MKAFGKENMKDSYKPRRINFRRQSNLYKFEDDASDEESVSEDCCSEGEREVNIFMVQGELSDEHIIDDEEEEIKAEVDLEGELVSALEELGKVRKEYKKYNIVVAEEQDLLNKSLEESKTIIFYLRIQLEEVKRMYEVTKLDLEKKNKECQKSEEGLANLRKELEKNNDEINMRIKYGGRTKELDKMLSKQEHDKDINGVGFEKGQCSNNKDSSDKEIHFTSSSERYTTIEVDDKDVNNSDKVDIDDEQVEGNDSVELDDEVENQGVVVKEWKESPRQFERQDQDLMNNIDTIRVILY
ncbi:uncharacterized protein LOC131858308 [Cryptomeria japonica]|uniref:uncharacterized protein LOC131858308 n=1 Tax=Cryptomeria japonica TaxID=3369 RepID=UPI0027DA7183|nr:uncharacterized protein LOC131858308 [Cryptomeria japonica]